MVVQPLLIFIALFFMGCHKPLEPIGTYQPLTTLVAKHGKALDEEKIKRLEGKEVQVWGYLDRDNLLLEERIPRFVLKRYPDDTIGSGVGVRLMGSRESYQRSFEPLKDIDTEQPIRVLVKGKLYTFARPTNFSTSTGVGLRVESVEDILVLWD